jgi:hypothetical protein
MILQVLGRYWAMWAVQCYRPSVTTITPTQQAPPACVLTETHFHCLCFNSMHDQSIHYTITYSSWPRE